MRSTAVVSLLLASTLAYGQTPPRTLERLPIKKFMFEVAVDDLDGRWMLGEDPSIKPDSIVLMARPAKDLIVFAAAPTTPPCSEMLERTDGTFASDGRMTASSLGLDARFYASVRTSQVGGRDMLVGCMDAGGRTLVVQWLVDSSPAGVPRASAVRVINAIAAGWRDAVTNVPQRLELPDGTELQVADRSVLWHVSDSVVMRVDDDSKLAVKVAGGSGTCEQEMQAARALRFDIVTAPPYLPSSWSPEVATASNAGTRLVMMCLPRKDGGFVELQWMNADPDAAVFGRTIRPVLEAFAAAYGNPPSPPPVPTPSPVAPPPATDPVQEPSSYAGSSLRVDDVEPSRPTRLLGRTSFALHNLSSEQDGMDDGYGLAIGYDGTLTRGGAFDLRLRASLGYDTRSKALFDSSLGVGLHGEVFGVHAVLGADGIGLGQDPSTERIKLPTDVYYGADADLRVTDIDVGFAYYARSDEMTGSEWRIELGYNWYSSSYKRRRLAFRYTHYDELANLASLGLSW